MISDNPYASPVDAASGKKRKKWLPTLAGGLTGLAVGLFCLFQPITRTPSVLRDPVQNLSGWMQRAFMPNSDPMAAFLFQIPLIVLLPAFIGVLAGFLLQIALQIVLPKSRK